MKEFLWVEKYRPDTILDCVLPDRLKSVFDDIVAQGEIPNMLLCGTAGTGKTTVAKALCRELGVDYILINGSDESGIDVLRTKIELIDGSPDSSAGDSSHDERTRKRLRRIQRQLA